MLCKTTITGMGLLVILQNTQINIRLLRSLPEGKNRDGTYFLHYSKVPCFNVHYLHNHFNFPHFSSCVPILNHYCWAEGTYLNLPNTD
jgi:hypothetical protein